MSVFFNGRLWVSPATLSMVDDSKMYARQPSTGNNIAYIGRAEGGQPNKALTFGSTSEATATLRGGDLLRAVERGFDASVQSPGPSKITVIRVNPATQSSLTLKDAAAGDSILLKSTNYGLIDNQIKVKVEAGTNVGLRLTTQFGTAYSTADDVTRSALSLQYSGTGTGTMTLDNATLTLTLNSIATAISLESFPTIQALVDMLNAVPGISAQVLDGNNDKPSLSGLDGVTAQDIKTAAFTVTANLQACIDWFNGNSEDFVTATRPASATKAPAPCAFTYLAGGSDGVVTNAEWTAAFTELQTADVQWVVPLSGLGAIHAMADAHVHFMTNIARMERRAICGTTSGTSDSAAITAAKNLNSDRTSLTHLGIYDYDRFGRLVMFEPYIAAAMIAAAFAGVNPGTPMTNKTLKVSGLERNLRNFVDTDNLINGGVLCLENSLNGYKVVSSISTWMINDNYNRREVSVGVALDYTMRSVRETLDELRGTKNNPQTLGMAISRTDTVLRAVSKPEPLGPGVLAGNDENPPFRNITASQDGDVISVSFECSPVIPVNYITVVAHASTLSATATAA